MSEFCGGKSQKRGETKFLRLVREKKKRGEIRKIEDFGGGNQPWGTLCPFSLEIPTKILYYSL